MNEKIVIELERIIFTKKSIIVKNKKGDITIAYTNIKESEYSRKNFINYLLAAGASVPPGWLLIKFKEKIGKRSRIAFKIKHEDLLKLPPKILNLLLLHEYYTPFA